MKSTSATANTGIKWTHWYAEDILYAEKCIIVKTSYSWWRRLFHLTHKCLFEDGSTMWVNPEHLIERN